MIYLASREPRCLICNSKHRKIVDKMLDNQRFTLKDVYAILKSLYARDDDPCPSKQSLRRHYERHLVSAKTTPMNVVIGDDETIIDKECFGEALMYGLAPLSILDFDKYKAAYELKRSRDPPPPLWSAEGYFEYFGGMADEVLSSDVAEGFRKRFKDSVMEYYPETKWVDRPK